MVWASQRNRVSEPGASGNNVCPLGVCWCWSVRRFACLLLPWGHDWDRCWTSGLVCAVRSPPKTQRNHDGRTHPMAVHQVRGVKHETSPRCDPQAPARDVCDMADEQGRSGVILTAALVALSATSTHGAGTLSRSSRSPVKSTTRSNSTAPTWLTGGACWWPSTVPPGR